MNKVKLYWICQVTGWSLYALSNVFFIVLVERVQSERIINNNLLISLAVLVVLSIFTSHIYRYFIQKWGWLKLFLGKLVPRVLLASLFLGLLTYLYMIITLGVLGKLNTDQDLSLYLMSANVLGYTFLYFFWSLIYFMYHYVESYNQALKYEASINEIRLNKLISQLNPHFIFNGLNSIRALVDENPAMSKVAITQLSNILRNSLIMDKERLIALSDEMNIVRDYLHLERIRFEERLNTEIDLDPNVSHFMVPPMMIQTLVENGIKHGISHLVAGGTLSLHAAMKDDQCLHIEIRNSGQYVNGRKRKNEGYGIENTKQRLELIFGDRAHFHISNESDSMVLTELIIPQLEK